MQAAICFQSRTNFLFGILAAVILCGPILGNRNTILYDYRMRLVGVSVANCLPLFDPCLAPGKRRSFDMGMSSALGQFGGLASLAGINIDSRDSRIEESLAALQSREFNPRNLSRTTICLPILFAEKMGCAKVSGGPSQRSKVPTPWKGYVGNLRGKSSER